MITAKGADRVKNLVHFVEGFAVHGSVESIEVFANCIVVEADELGIDIEQDLQ